MSISYSDPTLSTMRSMIEIVDRELAAAPPSEALRTAWAQIVEALALGSEPQLRECPHCHAKGMRAASRCSRCWTALAPLPPLETAALVAPPAT